MTSEPQTCGHRAEVALSWLGHSGIVSQRVCEVCAAMVWNRLAQPHRETFTCIPIEP